MNDSSLPSRKTRSSSCSTSAFGRAGRVALEAHRPPCPARGAADHDVPDRRAERSPAADDSRRGRERPSDLLRAGRRRRVAACSIEQSAAILKELLTSEPALPLEIDASAREVVTEVGNILLNACLGTFGNVLKVQVSFSVPHLTLETLEGVVGSIAVGREGLRYALIVHAAFRLRGSSLTGTW